MNEKKQCPFTKDKLLCDFTDKCTWYNAKAWLYLNHKKEIECERHLKKENTSINPKTRQTLKNLSKVLNNIMREELNK